MNNNKILSGKVSLQIPSPNVLLFCSFLKIKIFMNFEETPLKDSFLNYDEPTNGRDDQKPSTDDVEAHYKEKESETNNPEITFELREFHFAKLVLNITWKVL